MRRPFVLLITCAAIALVGLSVIGFAAQIHWSLDLLNHFRVQYLCASVLGIGVALLQRLKPLVFGFSVAALVNALLVGSLYFPASDQGGKRSAISIVSYNAWIHNDDWPTIAEMLNDNPDIVYLTEVHPNVRPAIRALESDYDLFEIDDNFLLVRRRAGLRAKAIERSDGIAREISLMVSIEGAEVALLAVHLAAPLNSASAMTRDRSIASITSWAAGQKNLAIVIGDFNATPWSQAFRSLQDQTGLINSQRGFGIQATWPSYPQSHFNWLMRIPIDHCLHSPAICTIDRRVGDPRKSNHSPLFVRLGIPTPSN